MVNNSPAQLININISRDNLLPVVGLELESLAFHVSMVLGSSSISRNINKRTYMGMKLNIMHHPFNLQLTPTLYKVKMNSDTVNIH